MALTEQKRRYAAARLSGLSKKESAVAAGCPEKTASQAASRYEKDLDVQAAMGRLGELAKEPEKPKRKHINKELRFQVLQRAGFKCAYCGKSPPEVRLEVEHIKPISKGGNNNIENLTCACSGCNRGKSDRDLDDVPNVVIHPAEDCPLQHMRNVMKDVTADPRLRFDAAKELAKWTEKKPGEGGKKEEKAAAAKEAGKGKFGAAPAPLRAVK